MNYSVARPSPFWISSRAEASKELGVISSALSYEQIHVYRFLSTLNTLGYVNQELETGRYALVQRLSWLDLAT